MGYTTQQFIEKIKPFAMEDMRKNKILASLTIAQGIIESSNGNSGLTVQANNLFGIKGNYNGQSVKMWTNEYYNGVKTRVLADFRKYPSWLESINDHSEFLRKYKRYASIIGETDYKQACRKMGASGYATSPTYAQTLLKTCETYKLYEIDREVLKGEPATSVPQASIKPSFVVGKTYTTDVDLYVRTEPRGDKKPFSELSVNAKKHAFEDAEKKGVLKKGTQVTVRKVVETNNQTWVEIPSGWICAINAGKIYVE